MIIESMKFHQDMDRVDEEAHLVVHVGENDVMPFTTPT
jgi:hypothetical protein